MILYSTMYIIIIITGLGQLTTLTRVSIYSHELNPSYLIIQDKKEDKLIVGTHCIPSTLFCFILFHSIFLFHSGFYNIPSISGSESMKLIFSPQLHSQIYKCAVNNTQFRCYIYNMATQHITIATSISITQLRIRMYIIRQHKVCINTLHLCKVLCVCCNLYVSACYVLPYDYSVTMIMKLMLTIYTHCHRYKLSKQLPQLSLHIHFPHWGGTHSEFQYTTY